MSAISILRILLIGLLLFRFAPSFAAAEDSIQLVDRERITERYEVSSLCFRSATPVVRVKLALDEVPGSDAGKSMLCAEYRLP